MKKTILFMALVGLFLAGCTKDDEKQEPPYIAISADGEIANSLNIGCSTGDRENIYFYDFDKVGIKLCKKNRTTSKVTVLDEITDPTIVIGDVLFANLHCEGDYLYYSSLHRDDKEPNTLWRVKKDGTSKEMIVDSNVGQVAFNKGKIYYTENMDNPSTLYSMNLDGSGKTTLISDMIFPSIKNDKIYYVTNVIGEFQFSSIINCSNLDGSAPKELYRVENNHVHYVIVNDKIYGQIPYMNPNNCSLMSMNLDGTNPVEIMNGLPRFRMNTDGKTLFVAINLGNNKYASGIYKYQPGYKVLIPIIKEPCIYLYMVGNNQIVYGNWNNKVGRSAQLYLTDFNGSKNNKL